MTMRVGLQRYRVVALMLFVAGAWLLMRTVTEPLRLHGFAAAVEPVAAMALGIVFWGIVLWLLFDVLPERRRVHAMQRELETLARTGRGLHDATDPLLRALGDTLASLAQTREKLERTERLSLLGFFAGGIAHQVGNPVSAARQYVEALQGCALEPQALQIVTRVRIQLDRVHRAVEGLLRFAQPERLLLQRIDIVALLRRVIDESVALRGVEITLPPGPIWVHIDEIAAEQVFGNLLRNAVEAQALHATGSTARIMIEITHTATEIAVYLHDYGPGFERPEATTWLLHTGKPGGTGLGLPLASRLTELLGGRLTVHNRADGATVAVILPAAGTAPALDESN